MSSSPAPSGDASTSSDDDSQSPEWNIQSSEFNVDGAVVTITSSEIPPSVCWALVEFFRRNTTFTAAELLVPARGITALPLAAMRGVARLQLMLNSSVGERHEIRVRDVSIENAQATREVRDMDGGRQQLVVTRSGAYIQLHAVIDRPMGMRVSALEGRVTPQQMGLGLSSIDLRNDLFMASALRQATEEQQRQVYVVRISQFDLEDYVPMGMSGRRVRTQEAIEALSALAASTRRITARELGDLPDTHPAHHIARLVAAEIPQEFADRAIHQIEVDRDIRDLVVSVYLHFARAAPTQVVRYTPPVFGADFARDEDFSVTDIRRVMQERAVAASSGARPSWPFDPPASSEPPSPPKLPALPGKRIVKLKKR